MMKSKDTKQTPPKKAFVETVLSFGSDPDKRQKDSGRKAKKRVSSPEDEDSEMKLQEAYLKKAAQKSAPEQQSSSEAGKTPEKPKQAVQSQDHSNPFVLPVPGSKAPMTLTVMAGVISIAALIIVISCFRVLRFGSAFMGLAVSGLILCLLILVINYFVLRSLRRKIHFIRRYAQYHGQIKNKQTILTLELADQAGVSEDQVVQDIQHAIDVGLLPQGHFGDSQGVVILTDQSFADYQSNVEQNDRFFEKMIAHYRNFGERPEEVQKTLDAGRQYVAKIKEKSARVTDPEISKKLNQMEETVTAIFHDIDQNPDNKEQLGSFLSVYLPSVDQVLQNYLNRKQGAEDGQMTETGQQISHLLDTANAAYERIRDRMNEKQDLELTSEIESLTATMKMEGLLDKNDERDQGAN